MIDNLKILNLYILRDIEIIDIKRIILEKSTRLWNWNYKLDSTVIPG